MLTPSVNRGSLRLRAAVPATPVRPPRKRLTPALTVALVAHAALLLVLASIPLRHACERISFSPDHVSFTFAGLAAPGDNPHAGGHTPVAAAPRPPAASLPFVRSVPKPVEPPIAVVVKDIPVTRVIVATPPPLPISPSDSTAALWVGDVAQAGTGAGNGTGTGVGNGAEPGAAGNGGTGPGGRGGAVIAQPDYLATPKPHYPSIARQSGWEGTTLLRVEIRKDGTTGLVEVLESSGHQVLDDAARESVRSARFQPARAGGAATNSWVEVPISFRLHRG